jgi:hypothetical protein
LPTTTSCCAAGRQARHHRLKEPSREPSPPSHDRTRHRSRDRPSLPGVAAADHAHPRR